MFCRHLKNSYITQCFRSPKNILIILLRTMFIPLSRTLHRPYLIQKLINMEWPGRAVVSLSAALVEMVETETESELALTKVTNP